MRTDPFWISFSLTPVQRFVEAARTVRDLKTGSALLSHLVNEAVKAGKRAGAERLFPAVSSGDAAPNKVLLTASDETTANNTATAMKDAAERAWQELALAVHGELSARWNAAHSGWCRGWPEQIGNYFEIVCFVVDFSSGPADLRGRWEAAARALQRTKQVRRFPPDQGIGRPKCTLLGEFEQMGPGGTLSEQKDFWEEVKGTEIRGVGLDRERAEPLCAVSLVKRFAPAVAGPPLDALAKDVPSTRDLAVAAWRKRAKGAEVTRQDLQVLEEALKELAAERNLDEDTAGEYLVAPPPRSQKPTEAEKKFFSARRALVNVKELGAPPRYFAVLAADADEMGHHLGGEFADKNKPLLDDFHSQLSAQLSNFAVDEVPGIVADHQGFLVYSGGDDTLALLPAAEAVACARKMRKEVPDTAAISGKALTLSAGIAVVHYKHDLRDALRLAREALGRAKAWGRDALGLTAVRRAGNATPLALSWEAAGELEALAARFAEGVSDRWVASLGGLVPAVHPLSDEAPLRLLLASFLRRVEGGKPGARDAAAEAARKLFAALLAERQERLGRRVETGSAGVGELARQPAAAFAELLDAAATAGFLVRGGE
ncbi:MAG: type III-B CRISPR-associated protein Cas10/Cmr2 [Thermoanaerobaculia bacterium]|nr:type III-B CRISPR-associated protein Cas10/Cmr2 [Thermoanaerobaculia bacterium]